MKKSSPRIHFNWGFHDGANDALRGKPSRRHGKHLFCLPAKDKPYCEGYKRGYQAARADEYIDGKTTSTAAWERYQAEKAAQKAERTALPDAWPRRF